LLSLRPLSVARVVVVLVVAAPDATPDVGAVIAFFKNPATRYGAPQGLSGNIAFPLVGGDIHFPGV